MRLFTGFAKPKLPTTGSDFAGEIAATGKNVTAFKTGEKVMAFGGGLGNGSHAQYFILPETLAAKIIVPMPANLTYEEAATCLEGAFYALNAVRGMDPKPGQKALVIGATGAIGAATVQFLKYYGVSITATCRGEHEALVRSLGAEKIIDYTKEDFTKQDEQYDLIFDSVGKTSFFTCKHLLKKKGKFTSSNGLINFILIFVTPLLGGKKVIFKIAVRIKEGLQFIKELIETGKFIPVTDRIYPLDKIADAYRYVMTGQKVGNVVITMDN
jgi:NADPH:quinone reductase-like Zn-dependent oxidoreductase